MRHQRRSIAEQALNGGSVNSDQGRKGINSPNRPLIFRLNVFAVEVNRQMPGDMRWAVDRKFQPLVLFS